MDGQQTCREMLSITTHQGSADKATMRAVRGTTVNSNKQALVRMWRKGDPMHSNTWTT